MKLLPVISSLKLVALLAAAMATAKADVYIRPLVQYSKLTYRDTVHAIETKGSVGAGLDVGVSFGAEKQWEIGGELTYTAFKGSYPVPVWTSTAPGAGPSAWARKSDTPYVVHTVLANARHLFGAKSAFVRPYVSMALGFNMVAIDTFSDAGGLGVTGSLGGGLMLLSSERFHLDIGYRYLASSSSHFFSEDELRFTYAAAATKHEFSYNAHNAYLALHWRF